MEPMKPTIFAVWPFIGKSRLQQNIKSVAWRAKTDEGRMLSLRPPCPSILLRDFKSGMPWVKKGPSFISAALEEPHSRP